MSGKPDVAETDERPSRNIGSYLPRFYLPLILLLCAAHAWRPLQRNDDFWAHAAVGHWIWQNVRIPRETVLLWSARAPWIAHSWLSQLTFYSLMHVGGERYGPLLAIAVTIFMVALTFFLIWHLWAQRARVTILMPFVFYLAIRCSETRYQARPELFTSLFLSCLLVFLINWFQPGINVPSREAWSTEAQDRFRGRHKLSVLGLIFLFIIWPDFHGAVAIGLVILAATVLVELVQEKLASHNFSPRAKTLALIAVVCAGAACLNPYGMGYWQALEQTQSMTFSVPIEWRPVWRQPMLSAEVLTNVVLLTILALASWAMNRQRRWSHVVWLLIVGYLFLTARRNVWVFSLVCLAVMAANASVLDTRLWWNEFQRNRTQNRQQQDKPPALENTEIGLEPIPPRLHLLARAATLVCLLLCAGLQVTAILPLRTVSLYLPRIKAEFIEAKAIPGRIFNDIDDSPYLEWRFGLRRPLFIDIIQAYPDQLTMDYLDIMNASPRGLALLENYKIGYITLSSPRAGEPSPPLLEYLLHNPRWKLVYSFFDGTVWVRRTPEYQYLWREIK